jgi:hypothetical protein
MPATRQERDRLERKPKKFYGRLEQGSLNILLTLNDFEYLRSSWLYEFCGATVTKGTFQNKLTYLFDIGLIERPKQQTHQDGFRSSPLIYRLTQEGRNYLRNRGIAVYQTALKEGPLPHNLLACEVMANIKLAVDKTPRLRFIFKHEILARAPQSTREAKNPFAIGPITIAHKKERAKTHYVADGWFGIEYTELDGKKSYRFFAVEINNYSDVRRTELDKASHLRKFLSLLELRRGNFFIDYLGIKAPVYGIFVQTEEHVTLDSMKLLRDELMAGEDGRYFLFDTIPTFQFEQETAQPDGRAFFKPWRRVVGGDFNIGLTGKGVR